MRTRILSLGLATGLLAALTAQAMAVFTFEFDENGNGRYQTAGSNQWNTLNGTLMGDPSGGLTAPVLVYDLPEIGLGEGDIAFFEAGGQPNSDFLSDIFRFKNGQDATGKPHSYLIFYSDNRDGIDSLADTGFPQFDPASATWLEETGFEGGEQWCIYEPFSGTNNRYHGLSDAGAVPGPLAAVPFLAGLAISFRKRLRK